VGGTPAYQINLTNFDANQRIGFEIECADVFLNMASIKGDTYGVPVIETTEKDASTNLPLVTVTLEERKGNENPKIEVITSPQAIDRAHFKKLKTYINAVVNLADTKTADAWAKAASQVAYTSTEQKKWVVSSDYQAYTNLKFSKKSTGERLVQCNLDLYLDQLYTAPALVQMMMAPDHQPIYMAAVKTVKELMLTEPAVSSAPNVGGLLVAAFYTALCETRWGGVKESLGKDRVQPLLKAGPDDLARLVLDQNEQEWLLKTLQAFHTATFAKSAYYQKLSQALSVMGRADEKNVNAIKGQLHHMFLSLRTRYQAPTKAVGHVVTGFGARSGPDAWDNPGYGNQVWWSAPGDPPATGTGKPLKPRQQGSRCLIVAEIRKSTTVFAQEMYMNL
jgi:hypothetical protein